MVVFQVRFKWVGDGKDIRYYLRATKDGRIFSEGCASDMGIDPLGFSEVATIPMLWEYLSGPVVSSRGDSYSLESYEVWPPSYVDLFGSGWVSPSSEDIARVNRVPDFELGLVPSLSGGSGGVAVPDVPPSVDGYVYYPGTMYIYGRLAGLSVDPLTSAEAVKLSREGRKLYHVEVSRSQPYAVPTRNAFLQIKRDAAALRRR
jgi:hypothetical protein